MLFFKRNKIPYYIKNYLSYFLPNILYVNRLKKVLSAFDAIEDKTYINDRLDYYFKEQKSFTTDEKSESISHFYKNHKKNTYFFDSISYLRAFELNRKFNYVFGDVTHVPGIPSFVKSRPISGRNENSVLLKLNKIRHYFFINDKKKYTDKKDILVWRGEARGKPHRTEFLKKLWNHPMCDVGQTQKPEEDVPWQKPKLNIPQQLDFKFIFCLEGNDVATNIKWVMSSNSLAFSHKMKYETWYMEGRLQPGYHFVLIKDDLSDLEEKMNYYSENVKEAQEIIKNAHNWVEQFSDEKREDIISFLVIKKYFELQEKRQ
ncbi:MAG TPA: lipopolysaccharide A protein [Lutibacter sp.]|nr:lipopolysaccharide A protein [Lutibacter sp.]